MTTRTATCRIFDLNTALDVMAAVENTGSDVLAMLTTGVTFGALDWSDVADYYASPIGPCNACDACRGHHRKAQAAQPGAGAGRTRTNDTDFARNSLHRLGHAGTWIGGDFSLAKA